MSRILSTFVFAPLIAIGLVLSVSPVRAEGKLDTIKKFSGDKAEMIVATYFDPTDGDASKKVGLIAIRAPRPNSFAFDRDEGTRLIALCDKAIGAQATRWTSVGTMTETGTSDVSKISVSAGPGVRFVISSPKGLTVTYVLQKADDTRFQKRWVRSASSWRSSPAALARIAPRRRPPRSANC